jgi:hypothetical protein
MVPESHAGLTHLHAPNAHTGCLVGLMAYIAQRHDVRVTQDTSDSQYRQFRSNIISYILFLMAVIGIGKLLRGREAVLVCSAGKRLAVTLALISVGSCICTRTNNRSIRATC